MMAWTWTVKLLVLVVICLQHAAAEKVAYGRGKVGPTR